MLRKVILTIPPHAFSFTAKCNFFSRISYNIFLQGDFVVLDIVFGCHNTTFNPSPVWELSFLTQFSGITTLQSLVPEKQYKEAWPQSCL